MKKRIDYNHNKKAEGPEILWQLLVLLVPLLALNVPGAVASQPADEVLLAGTIRAAQGLVFPHQDVKISYDNKTRSLYVKFTTPKTYKRDYAHFYERWRDNQLTVLEEFKRSGIPVKYVVVTTNFLDGSGVLQFRHLAVHVEKYAARLSNDMWLKTGTLHLRSKGSKKWKKME